MSNKNFKIYSKKQRIIASIFLVLLLVSLIAIFFSGCGKRTTEQNDTWVLLRLPDGNSIHTRVVDYNIFNSSVYIYTENRMYIASMNNVVFIKDLN